MLREMDEGTGGEARISNSVQQLKSGVYVLLIESEGYRKSYKIVKK